jgi:GT2 family glycosyltransferase
MYGEDVDLCARAASSGACPMFTPHAAIIHFGRRSSKRADAAIYILGAKIELANRLFTKLGAYLAERAIVAGVALRLTAYGALGRLGGHAKHLDKANFWRMVWLHRDQWRAGVIGRQLPLPPVEGDAISRPFSP